MQGIEEGERAGCAWEGIAMAIAVTTVATEVS